MAIFIAKTNNGMIYTTGVAMQNIGCSVMCIQNNLKKNKVNTILWANIHTCIGQHTHEPNPDKKEELKLITTLKRKATESMDSPGKLCRLVTKSYHILVRTVFRPITRGEWLFIEQGRRISQICPNDLQM